jgi:hypothetical protein
MSLIEPDDPASRARAFPSSVAVFLQDKVQADTFASDINFHFALIDAARRGVILAKVQNYGLIRWRTVADLIQWRAASFRQRLSLVPTTPASWRTLKKGHFSMPMKQGCGENRQNSSALPTV